MKKLITLFCFFVIPVISYAQQASDYFPAPGFEWKFKVTPLDSANNPVTSLSYFRIDSFATTASYFGKDAKIVVTKTSPLETIFSQPYTDSLFYNTEGVEGFVYLSSKNIEPFLTTLDQTGTIPNFSFIAFFVSLQNWYSTFRFGSNENTEYLILERDTTLTVSIFSIPVQFKYLGTRLSDETIQTVNGSYNCKRFLLKWVIAASFLGGDLITLNETLWIAPGNWIIQDIMPGQYVNVAVLTQLGIPPFSIPGFEAKLTNEITNVMENEKSLPTTFSLAQNYPNPFNPSTKISWQSPISGHQTLKVYDVLGNEVATLVDEYKAAGGYEVEFNVEQDSRPAMASGVYFYQVKAGEYIQTKKMLYLK